MSIWSQLMDVNCKKHQQFSCSLYSTVSLHQYRESQHNMDSHLLIQTLTVAISLTLTLLNKPTNPTNHNPNHLILNLRGGDPRLNGATSLPTSLRY